MAVTRKNIPSAFPGKHQLANGYTNANTDTDYTIPSCTIADVDESLCELFDKGLSFVLTHTSHTETDSSETERPTVVFAGGERFAVSKRLQPVTDHNGALILPAIAVRRTGLRQGDADMGSRGINQTTGEIIIESRLDSSGDRDMQNMLNRVGFNNLPSAQATTERLTKDLSRLAYVQRGELLRPRNDRSNYEFFAIPGVQFYTALYEITYWTGYIQHMNEMLEVTMNSQLPQFKGFKLVTPKGYWFIAKLQDEFQAADNFEDFSGKKKIIRHTFSIEVPAFLIGSADKPGSDSVQIRKYKNFGQLQFEVSREKADSEDNTFHSRITEHNYQLTDPEAPAPNMVQAPTANDKLVFEREGHYAKLNERYAKRGETSIRFSDRKLLEDFKSELRGKR